jgi:hypothetical protein
MNIREYMFTAEGTAVDTSMYAESKTTTHFTTLANTIPELLSKVSHRGKGTIWEIVKDQKHRILDATNVAFIPHIFDQPKPTTAALIKSLKWLAAPIKRGICDTSTWVGY